MSGAYGNPFGQFAGQVSGFSPSTLQALIRLEQCRAMQRASAMVWFDRHMFPQLDDKVTVTNVLTYRGYATISELIACDEEVDMRALEDCKVSPIHSGIVLPVMPKIGAPQ